MMKLRIQLCFGLLFFLHSAMAQGHFKHMQYNLTLYGNPFGCDETTNNTNEKDQALGVIVAHAQPDILCVNELRDQNVWADRILNQVLNADQNLWSRAALTANVTSSSIINGFFFREDKFTLHSQEVVSQALDGSNLLRPIDLYTIYVDGPGLAIGDTTFITCIVAHLAATDPVERDDQTAALMARLAMKGPGNHIFSGDLNMDAAWEQAFQNLISYPDPTLAFEDPLTISNSWNNNSSIALHHTQSTRLSDTNSGCFAGGGLDDRFDITLISPSIQEGNNGVHYINGSYKALGQNGNNYNQQLQIFGNGAVPNAVALALYDMSDHLPVITEFSTDVTISVSELQELDMNVSMISSDYIGIRISNAGSYLLEVYDLSGRLCNKGAFHGMTTELSLQGLGKGIYVLRIRSEKDQVVRRILVQ
jgi:endonuclease/exonuclease/phosphatase family metal-dependent hydrolase